MDTLNKQRTLICLIILALGLAAASGLILLGFNIAAIIIIGLFIITDIYYYVKTVKKAWNIKNTLSVILLLLIGTVPFGFIASNGRTHPLFSLIAGVALFSVFLAVNTPWQETLIYKLIVKTWHLKPSRNKNYNTYRRYCAEEWYRTHPSGISNLSVLKITQRVIFSMAFIFLGLYGIYSNKISIFQNERFFDIILCMIIILFAFYYYLFGFRHCALIAFISWYLLFGAFFGYRLVLIFFPNTSAEIVGPAAGTLFIGSGLLWGISYAKKRIMYSNAQSYEKGGKLITLDLFLASLGNIHTLNILTDITIVSSISERHDQFIRLIKKLIGTFRSCCSVFCGYTTEIKGKEIHIYVYTSKSKSAKLIDKACSVIYDNSYRISEINCKYDDDWTYYKTELYPNVKDLCSITSRNYIERLFLNGIALDKEYEIKFLIYCKNSNDTIKIENELKYFGFIFYRITYEQNRNKVYTGYDYCAEFKISTFITPRRLEYLSGIILNKTEGHDAIYMGEWLISSSG